MSQQSAGSTATYGSTASSPETPTIQSLLEDAKNMKDALKVFPAEFHSEIEVQVMSAFVLFFPACTCASLLMFPLRVRV
jgi:hypothetical protein